MARYPKAGKFCKNHPEVPAMENRNICYDCYAEKLKKYGKMKRRTHNQKYYQKYCKAEMFTVEDIQKLVDLRYPTWSIAKRFDVSESMITNFIRVNGITRSFEYCYGGMPVNSKTTTYF